MKIQDYKEGIYINDKNEVAEIAFKFADSNHPFIVGVGIFELEAKSGTFAMFEYFMDNYHFCCEF